MSTTLLTVGLALLLAGVAAAVRSPMPIVGPVSTASGVVFLVGGVFAQFSAWSSAQAAMAAFTIWGAALMGLGCWLYLDDRCRLIGDVASEHSRQFGRFVGHWSTTLGVLVVTMGITAHWTVTPTPLWWGFAIGCVVVSWWAVIGMGRSDW